MKPATQAVACNASTSALRPRIGRRSAGRPVRTPGMWTGEMSGQTRPATTQVAASSVTAIARLRVGPATEVPTSARELPRLDRRPSVAQSRRANTYSCWPSAHRLELTRQTSRADRREWS